MALGETARALREQWRKRYTQVLDIIFEEFASKGITVEPDEAMDFMEYLLERWASDSQQIEPVDTSRPPAVIRFNFAAYRRDAHHYAVDRFTRHTFRANVAVSHFRKVTLIASYD